MKTGPRIRGVLRCIQGATAVEYATIAPMLLLIIMGLVEYSIVMYGSAVLEGATDYAARLGGTGYVNNTTSGLCPVASSGATQTQVQYLNCVIAARAGGLFNSSGLQITLKTYDGNFDNISAPTFTTCTNTVLSPQNPPLCAENAGSSGDVVVYTIAYPWQMVTPILRNILGANGTFTITSSAVIRNEPYGTGR